MDSIRRIRVAMPVFIRAATVAVAAAWLALVAAPAAFAQDNTPPAAWRVECGSDGKKLDCRAVQQVFNRADNKLLALLTAHTPADSKTPVMMIQLPLGLNLAEPVQISVDNGPVEKQPVQTCTTTGCFVGLPLNDKLLAAMRSGTTLKVSVQDSSKRAIVLDITLLGFGLALDKTK
jgi:invasion protein IalB